MNNDSLLYIAYGELQSSYKIAILIKEQLMDKDKIKQHYIDALVKDSNLEPEDIIVLNLIYVDNKAPVVKVIKPWLSFLGETVKADLLLFADNEYYKKASGVIKTGFAYGRVEKCTYEGLESFDCALVPAYTSIYFDPKNLEKITLTLDAIKEHFKGNKYFKEVIKFEKYPRAVNHIAQTLEELHNYDVLSCDIETFSLELPKARIGTISFAWNRHEGVAFPVDLQAPMNRHQADKIRGLLRSFFVKFLFKDQKKIIWHNANFDVKVLIWNLFMGSTHYNHKGKLYGLQVFGENHSFEDTKLISYLATNSTAGNDLKLKTLALPFLGEYALGDDIKDITTVNPQTLLKYNLHDALATWYVHDVYYPKMVNDNQKDVYDKIFKPSVLLLLQTELHGMCVSPVNIAVAKTQLQNAIANARAEFEMNTHLKTYSKFCIARDYITTHSKWKTKTKALVEYKFEFNPLSPAQVSELLYEYIGLPILDYTDKKNPSTKGDALKKLKNHTQDNEVKNLLNAIIDFKLATKILSSFIPALENNYPDDLGNHYIFGNFNLGGTVSGRLSSSNPNLQNIPSGSTYAKIIKNCFVAPKGKLMVGLDFNSLEDYISALTTKDPNKLKVYEQSFDGHCLRAASYFADRMPDIYQVPKETRCFKAKVGSSDIYFSASDVIEYKGKKYSGSEFYEFITNN